LGQHTTWINLVYLFPVLNFSHLHLSFVDLKAELATGPPTKSPWPLSFEKLYQDFGFVLYEATPLQDYVNVTLELIGLADEAVVLVNSLPRGFASRQRKMLQIERFDVRRGDVLSVLVHNMGRINYGGFTHDFKGVEQVLALLTGSAGKLPSGGLTSIVRTEK
jgi:hypothetical protein